ncbi:3'-5' exoribonuclease YhaM family protein [Planctomycetota bacterium]
MSHAFINEITPGQTIDDVYMVKDPILRSTAKGDLYIAMYLCDKTGQVNGRMWQATEATYKSLPQPGLIYVRGRSELYQNNLQVVLNSVRPVDESEANLEDFLAHTDKDVDQLFREVQGFLGQIKQPQLKALMDAFLADEALMEKFRVSPAAVKMHHEYLGGLLEHTHNMMRVALAILPLYPEVQGDLVLAAILLHDMGKVEELSYDMVFAYTDSGQLIGHITKSVLMVHRQAEILRGQGVAIDEKVVDSLCHIILAHHGQYEFGSPKLPAMAEAFMVNYIDNLDAKINQVHSAVEQERSDATWTAWQNSLQTRLYRERIE